MTLGFQISSLPWFSSDPDEPLVSRAKAGDRKAFDSLVRLYTDGLRGFVARRVGPGAADDVLQDTWTACWLGIRKYGGRSRFKAWLYGIATHKCVDFHRRVPPATENLDDLEFVAGHDDVYGQVDLSESVRTALSQLPEAQREVVELYYYAGLTLNEIAANLQRNLNTVKYQFYRAHTQIEQDLKMEGFSTP